MAVAFLASLLAVPAAGAATLNHGGAPFFSYIAADGEANHLVLNFDGTRWTFTDTVPIDVSDDTGGCQRLSTMSASCPAYPADGVNGPNIDLGDGDDSFTYGSTTDPRGYPISVDLGSGTNTADGSPGNDSINGGPGNDTIRGQGGDDQLKGGGGSDTLDGGPGNDKLDAQEGSGSTLTGGPGKDTFLAGTGDTIVARDGVAGEYISCAGKPAGLSYDAANTLTLPGTLDDVQGSLGGSSCFGPGDTGGGALRPAKSHLRFRITRATRTLPVRFDCPSDALFGCTGSARLSACRSIECIAFSTSPSGDFFILPGQHVDEPLRSSRSNTHDMVGLLRATHPRAKIRFEYTWLPKTGDQVSAPVPVKVSL